MDSVNSRRRHVWHMWWEHASFAAFGTGISSDRQLTQVTLLGISIPFFWKGGWVDAYFLIDLTDLVG